ncbi:MAG TPA: hypothetical protein VGN16_12670 [Acidobacteriaceae bacterium]|jgi:hypothetical protein
MNEVDRVAPEVGPEASGASTHKKQPRWWRRRWFKVVMSLAVLSCAAFVIVAEYIIHNAEPILRKRVIETLSERFDSPVELDRLNISLVKGVRVEGEGLRIQTLGGNAPGGTEGKAAVLTIQSFSFRTKLKKLLHQPTNIGEVDVQGMELRIPPAGQRPPLLKSEPGKHAKISLLVDHIFVRDTKLFIESKKPGKDPLEFDIQDLHLQDVGASQPFTYTALLVNPKPVGNIDAKGHFGPWNKEDPSETPLDGDYSFTHADLNTIKGIGGMLSSQGHFGGALERLTVDGETDTPDFSLDVSDHPVPLHTKFHAIVDGTSGDTYLEPVQARLLHSSFTASGKVVIVKGKGHDIALDVDIPNARMEDMLRLGVKTTPPLMNGALTMKAKLHIPPGETRVPAKLELAGRFAVRDVQFNNPQVQDKVDGLSLRAQGHPKEVQEVSSDRKAQVSSQMQADFSLAHGLMTMNNVQYQIPGAVVLLNGVYSLDGNVFEMKGHVRTDAKASQMVTGWKSWLLKPVDHFLSKDGAGLQLPISVSGTQGDVHFGLARHGTADESSAEIATDLKNRKQGMLDDAKAKRERDKAQKEQEKADASVDGNRSKAERKAQKEQEKAERHEAAAQAAKQPQ